MLFDKVQHWFLPAELKQKIEETKQIADLGWLQQKVDEKLIDNKR